MGLTLEVRVGKRRTIVIPKHVAEMLGISEGSRLELKLENGKIVLEPVLDAIELSLHGEKIAKLSLEELEAESVAQQKKYIQGK